MSSAPEGEPGPVLLCYDGSEPARQAIERAGRVLGGGSAVVLTVWESVGSAILRHTPSEATELGREAKEISEDVVVELDANTEKRAQATAGEGAELAAAAGFDARPLAPRALARAAERDTATVWRAVLAAADEEDAEVIVLGSRGRSGFTSVLLGSVSYGVVHHSARPVLIIASSYLGDVYPHGTASDFARNYAPVYGRLDPITQLTSATTTGARGGPGICPTGARRRDAASRTGTASGWAAGS